MQQNAQITDRKMSVFLSSTFTDMQAERDYLVKKIFPSIKEECRKRNVDFSVLDLRWGITEEEARSGKVIEICMEQIEHTHPFFIGLIGGRYGWVPEHGEAAVSQRLLNRYPQLQPMVDNGISITEMEMQLGVLGSSDSVYAHFFLKNNDAISSSLKDTDPVLVGKLEHLRTEVREAAAEGRCTASDYKSLHELGKKVYNTLMETVNQLFPADKVPKSIFKAVLNQEADWERLRKIYFKDANISVYENQMSDEGGLLEIFYGDHGSGKSALVANMDLDWLDDDYLVVRTRVDDIIASADMLSRALAVQICEKLVVDTDDEELQYLYGGADPGKPFDVELFFERIAEDLDDMHYKPGHIVWLIDDADKLSVPTERNYAWLQKLTGHVSMVVLTVSDESVRNDIISTVSMFWDVMRDEIPIISNAAKMQITEAYLRDFAKSLTIGQRAMIGNAPLFDNPGTLMLFLNELLQFGVHEQLDQFIEPYTKARTYDDILRIVLRRIDNDFGVHNARLFFSLLSLCVYGISEEAMAEMLGMRPVEWAAFRDSVLPLVNVVRGRFGMSPRMSVQLLFSHYDPLSADEENRLRREIIAMARKEYKALEKTICRQQPSNYFLKIFSGGLLEVDDIVNERLLAFLYQEQFIQLVDMGKYRQAFKMVKGLNILILSTDELAMSRIVKIMENGIDFTKGYTTRFAIADALLLDYSGILIYKVFIDQNKEKLRPLLLKRIKRLLIPRHIKHKLLGIIERDDFEKAFIDLWQVETFEEDVTSLIPRILEIILIYDRDIIRKIYAKVVETIEYAENKNEEADNLYVYYYIAAVCAARLGQDNEANDYLTTFKQESPIMAPMFRIGFLFMDIIIEDRHQYFDEEYNVIKESYITTASSLDSVIGYNTILEYADALNVLENGDLDDLKKHIDNVMEKVHQGKVFDVAPSNIAFIINNVGSEDKASKLLEYVGDKKTDPAQKASDYYYAAMFQREISLSEAIRLFQKALNILQNEKPQNCSVSEYTVLGKLVRDCKDGLDLNTALDYAQRRMEIARSNNYDNDRIASLYNELAIRYQSIAMDKANSDKDEALAVIGKSLEAYEESLKIAPGDLVVRQNRNDMILEKYRLTGASDKELNHLIKDMSDCLEKMSAPDYDDNNRAITESRLFSTYVLAKRYDEAVKLYQNSGDRRYYDNIEGWKAFINHPDKEIADNSVSTLINDLYTCLSGKNCYTSQYLSSKISFISQLNAEPVVIEGLGKEIAECDEHDTMRSLILHCLKLTLIAKRDSVIEIFFDGLIPILRKQKDVMPSLKVLACTYFAVHSLNVLPSLFSEKLNELAEWFAREVGDESQLTRLAVQHLQEYDVSDYNQEDFKVELERCLTQFDDSVTKSVVEIILDKISGGSDSYKLTSETFLFIRRLLPYIKKYSLEQKAIAAVNRVYGRCKADLVYETDYILSFPDFISMYEALDSHPNPSLIADYLTFVYNHDGAEACVELWRNEFGEQKHIDIMNIIMQAYFEMHDYKASLETIDYILAHDDDGCYADTAFSYQEQCHRNMFNMQEALNSLRRHLKALDNSTLIGSWLASSIYLYSGNLELALDEIELHMNNAIQLDGLKYSDGNVSCDSDDEDIDSDYIRENYEEYYASMYLKAIIFIKMGNLKLAEETISQFADYVTDSIAKNEGEISLVALYNVEKADYLKRKGLPYQEFMDMAKSLFGKGKKLHFVENMAKHIYQQLTESA